MLWSSRNPDWLAGDQKPIPFRDNILKSKGGDERFVSLDFYILRLVLHFIENCAEVTSVIDLCNV